MTVQELMEEAKKAREKAYVPYSHFKVGAALETKDGQIIHGCNIENASYGLSNCAERSAFFSALSQGYKPQDFLRLAIVGDTVEGCSPCGACRQVIFELGGENFPVALGNLHGIIQETTSTELLPGAFGPKDL